MFSLHRYETGKKLSCLSELGVRRYIGETTLPEKHSRLQQQAGGLVGRWPNDSQESIDIAELSGTPSSQARLLGTQYPRRPRKSLESQNYSAAPFLALIYKFPRKVGEEKIARGSRSPSRETAVCTSQTPFHLLRRDSTPST